MKFLIFLVLLLFGTTLNAQNTYSKNFDLDSVAIRNYLNDLKIINNDIILSSSSLCALGTSDVVCVNLSKVNLNGIIEKSVVLDSFNSFTTGKEGLAIKGDQIKMSTHLKSDNFKFTSVLEYDQNLNNKKFLKYDQSPSISKIGNQGITLVNDCFYTYGIISNSYDLPDSIQIIKIDDAGNEIWRKYYTNDNASLKVNGLQGTPDGNLAFILELSGPQGPDDYFDGYHIIKIDTSGAVLDSFVVEETDKQPNRLLVSSDGSYYLGTSHNPLRPDDLFFGHYGAINKVNRNMDSIEWVFRMPSYLLTNGRTYELHDFLEARNGDIIVCGTVYDNTDTELTMGVPDKHSVWNGFIIRLTSEGEIKWLRLYKNPNDLLPQDETGRFRPSKLDKIKELPDGRLVGAGNVYVNNRQFSGIDETETEGFHLWLLMVDENGCLEGEECEEIIRIDGQIQESEVYLPIVKSGQTWVSQKGQAGPPEPFQYKYAEDSILQNSKYYFQRIQSDSQDGSDPYVEGIYRESMGKLYRKSEGIAYEEIVMDMSLGVGDVMNDIFDNLIVVMVDTVVYSDNIPRKRIKLECIENEDDPLFWVEGIGPLTDGTFCVLDGVDIHLRCVLDKDGDKIYSSIDQDEECWLITDTDDFKFVDFSLSPNPTRSKIKIEINVIVKKVEIYTNDGQMLKEIVGKKIIDMTPFQPGIYYLKIYTNEGIGVKSFIKL